MLTLIPLQSFVSLVTLASSTTAFLDLLPSRLLATPTIASSNPHRSSFHMDMTNNDSDDSDSDSDDPLARGIDSVSWLPSVTSSRLSSPPLSSSTTLPLFPLGSIVYTPNSQHILNIFEPRYRQMYNDILMNGSKRFVVTMCHPSESGRFAQMGVLFLLEELKEVSEMTADQVKYICSHKVVGRVRLDEVVNPEAWESRDTYLRVRGTIIDDSGLALEEPTNKTRDVAVVSEIDEEGKELLSSFARLVDLQHELSEDVRFTRASVKSFSVAEGTDEKEPNLWTSIRLWQSYAEQRLVARQNEMQEEFQEKLVEFLKKEAKKGETMSTEDKMKKKSKGEIPSVIGFQDLSPALQQELIELQQRMTRELKPLLLEQTLSMQKILEAEYHKERIHLMRYFVDAERKRLETRKTLKNMFAGKTVVATRQDKEQQRLEAEGEKQKLTVSGEEYRREPQIFEDEEDSFQ